MKHFCVCHPGDNHRGGARERETNNDQLVNRFVDFGLVRGIYFYSFMADIVDHKQDHVVPGISHCVRDSPVSQADSIERSCEKRLFQQL